MTIPKLTPYTGQVANPDGSQTQTEFTQNMFDQLSYEAQLATQLDATIDGMNNAVDEVEANAVSTENSANAAEAAASSAGYQGLWPDTGGSALKGEIWQTQVGSTPTGEYYTALQNTSVDPVGDNVNWKVNISASDVRNPNLLSNGQFKIASPDNSLPAPSATPQDYPAGFQIFSNWFADDTSGASGVTRVNDILNWTQDGVSSIYTLVPKDGDLTEYTASLAGKLSGAVTSPDTSHVSFSDNGDGNWRITISNSATDIYSCKLEQGSVATGHEVDYGILAKGTTAPRSLYDRFSDSIKLKDFGAVGDGEKDDTQALLNAASAVSGKRIYLDVGDGQYRLTSQVDLDQVWIKSCGAVFKKDHDGLGLLITGGSYYFRLRGDLTVEGVGAGRGDGLSPSTNINAHGIEVRGCRLDIDGRFESTNNQGNGFLINCVGNMNRSVVQQLHGYSNNLRGIRFSGVQDDSSVWQITTFTFGNYEGGVHVDDDFSGRQWDWYCYNEASNNPSGANGVYIGRLRGCKNISIYSEEQMLTGPELLIDSNCENLKVFDMRNNRSVNNSVETCSLFAGNGGLLSQSPISYEPSSRGVSLTEDGTRYIGKKYYGSSSALLMEERLYGTSVYERQLSTRSSNIDLDFSYGASLGDAFYRYGAGNPEYSTFSYGGSRSNPTDTPSGNVFSERHYGQPNGVLRELTRVNHTLDSVVGDRGVSSIGWAVTNNELLPVVRMTLQSDGVLNTPAGYLPFTGLHIGRSESFIESGMAVDIKNVIHEKVAQQSALPDRIPVTDEVTDPRVFAYNQMVDEIENNTKPTVFSQHVPVVSVTEQSLSKVCAGVVDKCILREDGDYDVYIAAVGDNSTVKLDGFKVCDEGGDIEAGDILCTSSTHGYLMKIPDGAPESVCRFKSMERASFVDGKAVVYGYFK